MMSFHSPTTSYGDMDGFHNGTAGIGKRVTLFANGSFVDGKGGSSPTWRVRQPRQPFLFLQRVCGDGLTPVTVLWRARVCPTCATVLSVDPFWTLQDLLQACSKRLGSRVVRVFAKDGTTAWGGGRCQAAVFPCRSSPLVFRR